MSKKYGQ